MRQLSFFTEAGQSARLPIEVLAYHPTIIEDSLGHELIDAVPAAVRLPAWKTSLLAAAAIIGNHLITKIYLVKILRLGKNSDYRAIARLFLPLVQWQPSFPLKTPSNPLPCHNRSQRHRPSGRGWKVIYRLRSI
ncbi:hypothetical protein EZ428_18715 [Pedobacter frigiditerrae]|uniref:Uncharacterized protein n=1 Tax=Pedobacter frigiditerrae TaxID=2530452 RepID=A0A4R0MPA8_9SPHI|nr:hypothetical protein [Pedobacter frigiditerrae]TCC88671.1 hypothetical protein EZ428_18715 [Pedobacter frigiditerrae]